MLIVVAMSVYLYRQPRYLLRKEQFAFKFIFSNEGWRTNKLNQKAGLYPDLSNVRTNSSYLQIIGSKTTIDKLIESARSSYILKLYNTNQFLFKFLLQVGNMLLICTISWQKFCSIFSCLQFNYLPWISLWCVKHISLAAAILEHTN